MSKAATKTAKKSQKSEVKVAADGVIDASSAIISEPSEPIKDLAGPDAVIVTNLADLENPDRLIRLDQAQNLPEIEQDVVGTDNPVQPVCAFRSAIEAFKDHDHRTMRVVVSDGTLHKQEI